MNPVYRIRNWDQHFEVAQSKRASNVRWVAVPNKHDGKSFRRLIRQDPELRLYGGWILIVQVASKCPVRGLLADTDGPLSVDDIADKTGASTRTIRDAINACCDPAVGWIEELEPDSECTRSLLRAARSTVERSLPTGQDKTGQNRTINTPLPPLEGDGIPVKGLNKAQLSDTGTVLRWLADHRVRLRLSDAHETTLHVLAAAECALRAGRRPSGLFRHLVACVVRGDVSQTADCDLDRAKQRLRDHDRSAASGDLRSALEGLKGPDSDGD